jgi:MFS transporter, DHA1 family, multidrug resistance protein
MNISFARSAIILGLLSAMGPFAIDMYLPALPIIANELNASTSAVQLSLMSFFAAVALCQVAYGPISDMVGRRPPLFFGAALFVVASIGCALSPSIEVLVAFRFLQGLGACAAMVIPRAIVRDLHTGVRATRLMSLIMLVFSVSPILAPLSGSLLAELANWRFIFWAVAAIGGLGIFLVRFALPETRPAEKRVRGSLGSVFASYGQLFRDPHFVGLAFIGGFGLSSFFTYIAGSSFVFIDHYGLTPMQYSVIFAANAIAFIGVSQLNAVIGARIGLRRMVRGALTVFMALTLTLMAYFASGGESMLVLLAFIFLAFGSLGLVVPSAMVLALENYGKSAGTASALAGTLQFATGAGAVALLSLFAKGAVLPMVSVIAICATAAFVIGQLVLRGREVVAAE